jgi:transposase
VERVDHVLPPEEQVRPHCQGPLHEMRTEVRHKLKIVPARSVIVEHLWHLCAYRACEKNADTTPIVKARAPMALQPGSPGLPFRRRQPHGKEVRQGMPLYRQEQEFSACGIRLSRQTMANWILHSSQTYLERICERLHEDLLSRRYLHADETAVQVLHEPGRKAASFTRVYRRRDGPPVVLYDYEETRTGEHRRRFLSGFKGYLHVDGYPGYHDLVGVTLVGCWAHARRKFDEAVQALPPRERTKPTAAAEGLSSINRLFED